VNIVPLLVLCSVCLGGLGVLLFLYSVRQDDHEHADRLALLPLEEEPEPEPATKERDDGCVARE
jgi:cbb3-type cytochrome oxidase maturation protein